MNRLQNKIRSIINQKGPSQLIINFEDSSIEHFIYNPKY